MWNVDLDRAASDASGVLAAYAALSFQQGLLFGEADGYFAKIPYARARQLARHFLARRLGRSFDFDLFDCQFLLPHRRCYAKQRNTTHGSGWIVNFQPTKRAHSILYFF